MRVKTTSFVVFFVFLFLVSANYGLAVVDCGTIESENLELTDCKFNESNRTITGKIKNKSDYEFGRVHIFFALYNEEGENIGTVGQANDYLGPKETWPFPTISINNDTVKKVKPAKLIEVKLSK